MRKLLDVVLNHPYYLWQENDLLTLAESRVLCCPLPITKHFNSVNLSITALFSGLYIATASYWLQALFTKAYNVWV